MTKRERKMLANGINPATGQALVANVLTSARQAAPRVAKPKVARMATAAVPWVSEARAAHAAQSAAKAHDLTIGQPDRVWTYAERGVSGSGRDTIILTAGMRNGGSFRATFPGDAVRAIAAGRVIGLGPIIGLVPAEVSTDVDVEAAFASLVDEPDAN